MLTKSEYSSSTSSLSTVFSCSLADLNSKLSYSSLANVSRRATKKPSYFKSRLRDRIKHNKERIKQLKEVIEVSKNDELNLDQIKNMIYKNEMMPLVTFVDRLKNTSDYALLSMQRELTKKETQLVFEVSQQKFTAEENAYLACCSNQQSLFKHHFFDKENSKYDKEVKRCDRLLKEGEELVKDWKDQIQQKDKRLQEVQSVIEKKEDILAQKLKDYTRVKELVSKEQDSSSNMKSYILEAKMKNTKQDIRRLMNEKLELESTEVDCKRQLNSLNKKLDKLNTRICMDNKSIEVLEAKVGDIGDVVSDETQKHSKVAWEQEKLQDVLKRETKHKEDLLKQVSIKKKTLTKSKLKSVINSRMKKPRELTKIDHSVSFASDESVRTNTSPVSNDNSMFKNSTLTKKYWTNTTQETEYKNESKEQISLDNMHEKNSDLSLTSFDPDWEFAQPETRLPISSQFDNKNFSTNRHDTSKTSFCRPIASSSSRDSLPDIPEILDNVYLNWGKIQEENDEDSVKNMTPRLNEDVENRIKLNEETQNKLHRKKNSAGGELDTTIYESKATLETIENSLSKQDEDCDFNIFEDKGQEGLSLSAISSDGSSNEEKVISASSWVSTFNKIPTLDLDKVRRIITFHTNNRNHDSKTLKQSKTTIAKTSERSISTVYSSGEKPNSKCKALKQQYQKPISHKKNMKSISKNCKKTECKNKRPKEENVSSWKEHKATKCSKLGFKANHWDFAKKSLSLYK